MEINDDRQYYRLLRKILKKERFDNIIKKFKRSPHATLLFFKRSEK